MGPHPVTPVAWRAGMRKSVAVYQWANESGTHGMARPAALERIGYVKVRQHPLYPKSWLMRKEASCASTPTS